MPTTSKDHSMDEPVSFSMVQEACDSYEVRSLADGCAEICLVIPPRFTHLWLVKLSELRFTVAEVEESPAEPSSDA